MTTLDCAFPRTQPQLGSRIDLRLIYHEWQQGLHVPQVSTEMDTLCKLSQYPHMALHGITDDSLSIEAMGFLAQTLMAVCPMHDAR